jgi:hypothetical protein
MASVEDAGQLLLRPSPQAVAYRLHGFSEDGPLAGLRSHGQTIQEFPILGRPRVLACHADQDRDGFRSRGEHFESVEEIDQTGMSAVFHDETITRTPDASMIQQKPAVSGEPRVRFQPVQAEVGDRTLLVEAVEDDGVPIEHCRDSILQSMQLALRRERIHPCIHFNYFTDQDVLGRIDLIHTFRQRIKLLVENLSNPLDDPILIHMSGV